MGNGQWAMDIDEVIPNALFLTLNSQWAMPDARCPMLNAQFPSP
jgi:hypothetical protein